LRAALALRPDVCLLDAGLSGGAGRACELITDKAIGVAVVILSDDPTERYLVDAIMAGAKGYLPKETSRGGIAAALRGIVRREAAIPRSLVARIVDEFRDPETPSLPIP
jgi:DNA-binding NarL/FixJ family response regulator